MGTSENVIASAQEGTTAPAWWPIDLAVKDGRALLLFDPVGYIHVGYWDGENWVMVDEQTGGYSVMHPTKFFPFPAP